MQKDRIWMTNGNMKICTDKTISSKMTDHLLLSDKQELALHSSKLKCLEESEDNHSG